MSTRKTNVNPQYRQGDILFELVDLPDISSLPEWQREGVKTREADEVVVALGEVTGHRHVLVGKVEVIEVNGTTYFGSREGVLTLKHDEHTAHELPKPAEGKGYRMVQQREFDPFRSETRAVID